MKTYILCVGKIVNGPIDWKIAPPPVDGELQQLIDDGETATVESAKLFNRMLWAMIGDDDRFDGDIEDDHDWIRGGGS